MIIRLGITRVEEGMMNTAGEVCPTGFPELDTILGGGLPRGWVVEVFGDADLQELLLQIVAAMQRAGGVVAWVDPGYLDRDRAGKAGVDLGRLLVAQPDDADRVLGMVGVLARTASIDLIVAPSPIVPNDDDMGMRYASQNIRKLVTATGRTGTTVVFVTRPLASHEFCPVEVQASVRIKFKPIEDVPGAIRARVVDDDRRLPPYGTATLRLGGGS